MRATSAIAACAARAASASLGASSRSSCAAAMARKANRWRAIGRKGSAAAARAPWRSRLERLLHAEFEPSGREVEDTRRAVATQVPARLLAIEAHGEVRAPAVGELLGESHARRESAELR